MKKVCMILVLCLAMMIAYGQTLAQVEDADEEKELATKLESFLAERGKLIVKEFYTLGEVRGSYQTSVKLSAVVLYTPGEEDERVRGLRFTVEGGGTLKRSNISFLDLEEIEGLSKAIDYVISLSEKWEAVQKDYTEVEFSTEGDLTIGFYQRGIKQKAFMSSGRIGRVMVHFSKVEKLHSIKVMADRSLKLLSEK